MPWHSLTIFHNAQVPSLPFQINAGVGKEGADPSEGLWVQTLDQRALEVQVNEGEIVGGA